MERSPPSERNSLCKGPRAEVPGESRAAEVGEVRDQGRTGAWQALGEGKVAVLPVQTWCTVRAFSSRTGASCSQGLRLRNLYSEVSMLKASAEALPRRFCQHLLIRGLGLSTFPHSDRVHLHAYLFPPFDPRSCKKAGSLFCRAPP